MKKDDDLKKINRGTISLREIGEVVKETIRPLKELVEVLKNKVDHQELYLTTTAGNVRSVKEQQSVINEKLDTVIKDLDKVEGQLNNPESGLKRINEKLDALWDQTGELTVVAENVKESIKNQATFLNRTNDNIRKIDKRLSGVEHRSGIVPPPELTLFE